MSDNRFNSFNLFLIFFASITVGIVSAYVYTSDFSGKNEEKSSSDVIEKKTSENNIKPSQPQQNVSNQININTQNNSQENKEKTYYDYLNQGLFYLQYVIDNFNNINENLDQSTGKSILENVKINIINSEKFLKEIPPESKYYAYGQEYQKYNTKYQDAVEKWQQYFDNKNRSINQQISPPNYPELTIKNKAVFVSSMKPKSIVLTFDDGPTKEYTIRILDILKKYNVKGTFFVVGKRVQENCRIVQRMYQEGHEIANHSYTHPYLTKISVAEQQQEIGNNQQIIQKCIGYQPRWFRAPFGDQNPALLKIVHSFGLSNAQWTIDTDDWRNSSSVKSITNLAINSNNSAVILMHDGAKTNPNFIHPEESFTRNNTVDSVEKIIINYRNRGFRFFTLSQVVK